MLYQLWDYLFVKMKNIVKEKANLFADNAKRFAFLCRSAFDGLCHKIVDKGRKNAYNIDIIKLCCNAWREV